VEGVKTGEGEGHEGLGAQGGNHYGSSLRKESWAEGRQNSKEKKTRTTTEDRVSDEPATRDLKPMVGREKGRGLREKGKILKACGGSPNKPPQAVREGPRGTQRRQTQKPSGQIPSLGGLNSQNRKESENDERGSRLQWGSGKKSPFPILYLLLRKSAKENDGKSSSVSAKGRHREFSVDGRGAGW